MQEGKRIKLSETVGILWRHSVIILACFTAIGIICYLAWANYENYKNGIIDQNLRLLQNTAQSTAKSLEYFIEEHTEQLRIISEDIYFKDSIFYSDTHSEDATHLDPVKTLYDINKGDIDAAYAIDSKGVVLDRHPLVAGSIGRNYADKEGFKYTSKTHKLYVSEIFKTSSDKFAISITAPVLDKERFIGVVRLLIESSTIYRNFLQHYNNEHQSTWIIDNSGKIISHPVAYHIGNNYLEIHKKKYPNVDWSKLEALMEVISSGKSEATIFDYHHTYDRNSVSEKKLIALSPAHINNELWTVGVTKHYAEIAGPINIHARNILLGVGALFLLLGGLGYVFYKKQKREAVLQTETNYLKRMAESAERLKDSEGRFRNLFTHTPVSIWEVDFSEVGKWIDDLRSKGVSDLSEYLRAHPEALRYALTLISVLDVNEASLEIFEAHNKEQLFVIPYMISTNETYDTLTAELLAIWEERDRFEMECTGTTFKENRIDFILQWTVPHVSGRLDFSNVIIAISDITKRKKAEETLRNNEREAALMARAARIFNSSLEINEVFDKVAKIVSEEIKGTCILFRINGESLLPTHVFNDGTEDENLSNILADNPISLHDSITGFCVEKKEPILIPDVSEDKRFLQTYISLANIHSYICVPLVVKGDVLGVLTTGKYEEHNRFGDNDLKLVVTLADRAATALENSILYEKEKTQAKRLSVVNELSKAVNSTLDIESIYEIIVEQLKQVFSFPFSLNIALYNSEHDLFYFSTLYDPTGIIGDILKDNQRCPSDSLILSTALKEKRINYVTDATKVDSDKKIFKQFVEKGIRSVVNIPLIVEQECIGTLNLLSSGVDSFTKDELELLETISSHLATAINNARIYDGLQKEIYDRMRTEEELVRLSTAIEQAAEAILITDINGNILYVNPAFEEITGYSKTEVLGRNPRVLKSGKHGKAFYKKMWDTLTLGRVWKGNFINKKKDGSFCEEEATISPVRDSSGEIVNYVAVKRDVTQEVLLKKQLLQAQKMEAIGTLAGGIAHDFKNMLGVINGNAQLALFREELPENSPTLECIQQVLKTGNRAAELIDQILTFSRQDGQERKPVQIGKVVKEALKMLRTSLPTTINIQQNIQADQAAILSDSTHIHQVLMNLCTNAAHAMNKQGGILRVALSEVELNPEDAIKYENIDPGPYVKLVVSDSGHGMEPKVLDRIFDPFFTTKEKGEGTGLGLAVVHGIVKSLGGTITVKSKPGNGTTFDLFFPMIKQDISELDANVTTRPLTGNGRVLFVDDEEDLTRLGQEMLRRLGYDVVAEKSSVEALAKFRAQPGKFDMVITDQTMPDMTGDKLALNLMEIRPDIPIILCTGYSDMITPNRAKAMGIKEFKHKPIDWNDMAQTIRQILDNKG